MTSSSFLSRTIDEQEAMAGLLQLHAVRIHDRPTPQAPMPSAEAQPANHSKCRKNEANDDDHMQTVSAAWVLTRRFSPNGTNSAQDSLVAQNLLPEAAGDASLDTNHSPTQICAGKTSDRKIIIHSRFTPKTECCRWKHGDDFIIALRRKKRDVASQTEDLFETSTSPVTDLATDSDTTEMLEQLVREGMKRKTNGSVTDCLTVMPSTSAEVANPVTRKPLAPATPVVVTRKGKSKNPASVKKSKPSNKIQRDDEVDEEGLVGSDEEWQPEDNKDSKHRRRYTTSSSSNKENVNKSGTSELNESTEDKFNIKSDNDLVPIGEGHAKIPARMLKHMNWTSYTSATRKLLTAVFPRSVLATHSLTGRPSPAFPNKPAKKKLNAQIVNDIVHIVVEKCGVPENVVRTSITTKCADESKMMRTRQRNKNTKNR